MQNLLRISKAELQTLCDSAVQADLPEEVLVRLRWFLHYVRTGSVSKTCREFGIARTTLYRWFRRFGTR